MSLLSSDFIQFLLTVVQFPYVKRLDISSNMIGDVGALALAVCLAGFSPTDVCLLLHIYQFVLRWTWFELLSRSQDHRSPSCIISCIHLFFFSLFSILLISTHVTAKSLMDLVFLLLNEFDDRDIWQTLKEMVGWIREDSEVLTNDQVLLPSLRSSVELNVFPLLDSSNSVCFLFCSGCFVRENEEKWWA